MINGKLSRIAWGRTGNSGETIIQYSKVAEPGWFPIYLDMRSQQALSLLVGKEFEMVGHLTLNEFDGTVRSGQVTPVNIGLLNELYVLAKQTGIVEEAFQRVIDLIESKT